MKVGIFDSGLGGLTVVREIKRKYSKSSIVYLGDTARIPYGTRSPETIQKFAIDDAKFLEAQGVDKIIIACHTASAWAFDAVKNSVTVPVIAMIEPTISAVKKLSKSKRVGILGTRATINSHVYLNNLTGYQILEQACPLLVPLIEEGETTGEIMEKVLSRYLQSVKDFNVDTVVLACTHYPIVSGLISNFLGENITLINPGQALAEILDLKPQPGEDQYLVTDLTPRYVEVAKNFLGYEINPVLVQL